MAKKLKKVLALALTMSMCMSFVTTTAFAQDNQNDTDTPAVTQPTAQDPAEGADDIALTGTVEVQTKPDGTTESIDVTISVEQKADDTVAVKQQTPEGGDTTPDGVEVNYQATSVVKPAETPEQPTADEPTEVTGELISQEYQYTAETKDGVLSVQGGTETNEETILPETDDEGNLADPDDALNAKVELYDEQGNLKQPTEEDPLKAQGSSETASSETKPTDEGDKTQAEDPKNFDQTTTTTTDRVVDLTITSIDITTGDLLFMTQDANGNEVPLYRDDAGNPIYVDSETGKYVDAEGNEVDYTRDDGVRYRWINYHDVYGYEEAIGYNYAAYSPVKDNVATKDVIEGFTKWCQNYATGYVYDADGNQIDSRYMGGLGIRVVVNDNDTPDDLTDDELIGGLYCLDAHTGVRTNVDYRKVNLEDAVMDGYYDEEDAAHLRAIMNNGFVSHGDGKGNVTDNFEEFKQMLKDAQANGAEELAGLDIDSLNKWDAVTATGMAVWHFGNRFDLEEDQRVEVRVSNDKSTAIYKYLITLEEPLEDAEGASAETQIINQEKFVDSMELVVGSMVQSDEADHNNNDDDDTNDVYDVGLKFSLVVTPDQANDDLIVKVLDNHGNVVQAARIAGDNSDGAKYDYAKTETDENGKTYYILEGMQLTENSDTEFNLKLEGTQYLEEGVYVFTADKTLKDAMQETYDNMTTDEKWESTQKTAFEKLQNDDMLPEGITSADQLTKELYREMIPYVTSGYGSDKERLKDEDGTWNEEAIVSRSQNLIGKFDGTAEVNVGMSINLTFNVEESTVTTKREWREEKYYEDDDDNEITPIVTPDNTPIVEPTPTPDPVPQNGDLPIPEFEIPEEPVPLAELPDEDVPLAEQPLMELPEDPIPLANVPKTGDTSGMWYAMTAAAALALAVMMLTEKRKEEN